VSATAPREKAFLLARPEQRLLEAIARRLPEARIVLLALLVAIALGNLRVLAAREPYAA
jgi:hypothetical protein